MSQTATVKALTFDVGGTMLDWHGSLARALAALGERKGIDADWARLTNAWRRRAMATVGEVREGRLGWMNLDAIHRTALDAVLDEFAVEGLSDDDKDDLTRAWHRLEPWPDAPAGLARLRQSYIVSTLTTLNVALVVDASRHAGFTWDCVFSCEMLHRYKPDPVVYRTACELLALRPEEMMMVACHHYDLRGAQRLGYRTAFVPRPAEFGPEPQPDTEPDPSTDLVARDFNDLADKLGA